MLIDLLAVRRAFAFVAPNFRLVLTGSVLCGIFVGAMFFFAAPTVASDGAGGLMLWLSTILFVVATLVTTAGWGRAALGKPTVGLGGLALGGDERRLAFAGLLVFVLSATVLLTAGLAVAFMIAALALINVDPEAPPPAEGELDFWGLFGTGEWIVAMVIFAVYGLFALWFFLRLAMSYPATVDAGQIQIMRVWPLSGKGRAIQIMATVVASALPGIAIVWLLQLAAGALLGSFEQIAQSAGLLALVSFGFGTLVSGLIGAPVCASLCALYTRLREEPAGHNF